VVRVNQAGGLGLVLSGGILGWLNIKKEEQHQLANSTRIDPDSQLVETIQMAAKSINICLGRQRQEG